MQLDTRSTFLLLTSVCFSGILVGIILDDEFMRLVSGMSFIFLLMIISPILEDLGWL